MRLVKLILGSKSTFECFLEEAPDLCFLQEALNVFFQDPLEFLPRIGFKNFFTKSSFTHFKIISKRALTYPMSWMKLFGVSKYDEGLEPKTEENNLMVTQNWLKY